jgi:hypothetical protein
LVTAPERSVIGNITRSGLDTRKSRPPASTITVSDAAMPGVLRHRRPAHRRRTAAAHPTSPASPGSTGSSGPREPDEATASECPRERRQSPRALLLGATSASGAHAISGRRGGTPCPARKSESDRSRHSASPRRELREPDPGHLIPRFKHSRHQCGSSAAVCGYAGFGARSGRRSDRSGRATSPVSRSIVPAGGLALLRLAAPYNAQ